MNFGTVEYFDILIQATAQTEALQWSALPAEPAPTAAGHGALDPTKALTRVYRLQFREKAWERRAKKWHGDKPTLQLQGKWRTTHDIETIVGRLNASRIDDLAIKISGGPLEAYATLFDTLNVPGLRKLCVEDALPASAGVPLERFLRSPRSHGLVTIDLDGGFLHAKEVGRIADALRTANRTVTRLCLSECYLSQHRCVCDLRQNIWSERGDSRHPYIQSIKLAEDRNRFLTTRVRQAAVRALVPARILLRARAPEDYESSDSDQSADTYVSSTSSTTSLAGHINKLPRAVVIRIVQFASRDPGALSGAQLARIVDHASDAESLKRVALALGSAAERGQSHNLARLEWLSRGGFFWEGRQAVAA
ncbi:hypothetical protein Q8F55_005443 [Vanrija albida]|uniref:Uncharacterized protein n=1 Tax=Vanrija albida TaxID=181172 RepID=A0ABR3Q1N7_9TREE